MMIAGCRHIGWTNEPSTTADDGKNDGSQAGWQLQVRKELNTCGRAPYDKKPENDAVHGDNGGDVVEQCGSLNFCQHVSA